MVVPGLNDTVEDMRRIRDMAEGFPNLKKLEWLPFHNLCLEKYQSMGIPFPLQGVPPMDADRLEELIAKL